MDVMYPRSALNGLWSVDESVDITCVDSASWSMVCHCLSRDVVRACGYWVSRMVEISDSLSVRGWNAVDMTRLVYNLSLSSTQISDVKRLSLLLMGSCETVESCMLDFWNNFQHAVTSTLLAQCIEWARLEKWSPMITIQSFPVKDVHT